MKEIGNTYGEVLSNSMFTAEESATLLAQLKLSFSLEDEAELLETSTSEISEFTTGKFFLVEDETDIETMLADTGCADVRETADSSSLRLDMANYLNSKETMAILMQCTSDSGGDVYIIPAPLLEQFPTIKEHIFWSFS